MSGWRNRTVALFFWPHSENPHRQNDDKLHFPTGCDVPQPYHDWVDSGDMGPGGLAGQEE